MAEAAAQEQREEREQRERYPPQQIISCTLWRWRWWIWGRRLSKRLYIKKQTSLNLLSDYKNKEIEISFDEIIRPYKIEKNINNKKSILLKQQSNNRNLINIKSIYQFENIITKQLKNGYDFKQNEL